MPMKQGTISRWVCIRECYDNKKVWTPGEVIRAEAPPMPRHFRRLYQNESGDPVEIMRKLFDDKGMEWDPDWSYQELVQRLNSSELEERRKSGLKRQMKADQIRTIEHEKMMEEIRKEVEVELKEKYGETKSETKK